MQRPTRSRVAFPALLAGAAGIGFAPIFVRLSEVGPIATAFYRLLLALPILWIWMRIDTGKHRGNDRNERGTNDAGSGAAVRNPGGGAGIGRTRSVLFLCAGFFFAGDLAFWHWSIQLTTVANSTLLINFAPFFVMIGARVLFAEQITGALLAGMCVAFAGGAMLVGASIRIDMQNVSGDVLALVTAFFYAGYLLMIKRLRRDLSTACLMVGSGIASCLFLGLAAWLAGESFVVATGRGWMVLSGLALVSHVGGQSFIAYSLAHLPASFSSVSLMLQSVVAALLAWALLSEALGTLQVAGGVVILIGIALASRGRSRRP